jgi:tRNA A-37 threonylcarbamoyl transferase component Bud32
MESIGRYQIVKELGHGAMGVVYQAVDPTIGRQVAIKTIRLDDVDDPDERAKLRERLFREARSAGILSHPGIVTIYDMEERGDVAFIAMEFVDGPTLDQLLSSKKPITPERLINILRQTAAALDYAHAKGIVHRDIKPANIMMASDGAVKITDFGIAKVTTSQQYTQTGTILGTPNYMSPEQVQGLAVTGRADQFSLAVIAFEMLTGERPFTGEHLTTVVYKIVAEDPPPVQRINPTLSPQIDAVLRRALTKKPEGRYNLCIEFVSGLDAACANTQGWKNLPRGGGMNMPTVATEAVAVPALAGLGTTTEEALAGRRRSASRWALPFAAALIVAIGLIGLIALQFGPGLGTGHTAIQPPPPAAPNPPANVAQASNPPAASPVEDKKPSPMDTPMAAAPVKPGPSPTQTATAKNSDEKTQLPAETDGNAEEAASDEQLPKVKARPANGPQDVLVTTEPAGATAVLDNNAAVSCKTPCMLSVLPGRHAIALNQDGYQRESREIRIIDSPLEIPTITLRKQSGTLMLNSTPPGAAIFVNDKQYPQATPTQLSLPPGTYNVRVEKNGLQKSKAIEIQNGVTNYINIPLQ